MTIPEEKLDEFITAYERAFNEPICRDEAREMLTQLVLLYRGLVDYVRRSRQIETASEAA